MVNQCEMGLEAGWTQKISSRSGAWEVAQVGPNGRSITAVEEEDPRQ